MNIHATDSASQCARMMARLREGPATTVDFNVELNIMRPGARIDDLRKAGHDIRTHLIDVIDPWGRKHSRVALYYLPTVNGTPVEAA